MGTKNAELHVKFRPPAFNEWVVTRERVKGQLVRLCAEYRVVWVLGSPGSGKTTAVSQAFIDDRIAWLTLDPSDATPGRFLAHLESALAPITPGPPGAATEALKQGASHIEATRLLAESLGGVTGVTLVLDELEHVADTPTTAVVVAAFLRNLPEQVHAVLISRKEVPLQLGSVLGVGGVGRLDETDLALTVAEAAQIIGRLRRSGVEPEAAVRATGGWVAGVLFEAWRSPLHSDGAGGDADALHSYLAVEIMQGLSPAERWFLTATSVLDAVTAGEAERLGLDNARAIFGSLRRMLLPMSVSADGEELRYHPRFRQFLRQRLDQEDIRSHVVHLRHGELLQERGFLEDAVDAFLAGGDLPRAAACAEAAVPAVLDKGDVLALERWLKRLDPEAVDDSPVLTRGALAVALDREEWNRGAALADRLQRMSSDCVAWVENDATFAGMIGTCYTHVGRPGDAWRVVDNAPHGPERDTWQLALSLDASERPAHYRERPDDRGNVVDGLLHRFDLMHGRLDRLINGPLAPWAASRTSRLAALRAAGRLQDATAMLRDFPSPERSPALSRVRIELLADMGLTDEAMAALESAREVARRSSSYCVQLHSLLEAHLALRLHADVRRARNALALVAADPTALQHRRVVEQLPLWTGLADLLSHDNASALLHLRTAVTYMQKWDRLLLLPQAAVFLAEAEWRAGNSDAADRACDDALSAATIHGSHHLLLQALREFPQVLSRRLDACSERDTEWHRLGRAVLTPTQQSLTIQAPGSDIRVREFGRPHLEVDGHEVNPGLTRSVELLAYLADKHGSSSRSDILRDLFDQHDQDSASAYLRQATTKLRKALPADHLEATPTGLRWLRGSLTSDAGHLERAVVNAGRLRGEAGLDHAQRALAGLPPGEFLQGSTSRWAEHERSRIAQLIEELHLSAAEAAFDLGAFYVADQHLGELIEQAPYRETAWRLAMRVASALGQDDKVIDLFRSCTSHLAEISMKPSRETMSLVERLRR